MDLETLVAGAREVCCDLPDRARTYIPLATTLIDERIYYAGFGALNKRRDIERQVAADVRAAAKVTFFTNPLLWWQIGVMVMRLVAWFLEKRNAVRIVRSDSPAGSGTDETAS